MAHRVGERARGRAVSLPPARLVLDTNAWLDLLVFRDPRVHRLAVALEDGHARALVQPAMRAELERVLAYPALALDDARRAGLLQRFSTLCVPVDTVAPVAAPRCSDADDQMFVDLALAARAHALLSRDEALLRLAPRLRAHGIQVATPADWCAAGGALQISKR
jgi:putative PIN family toxin of toxin-antitoxin system